ncbi:MAG: FimV/HubP family polar landmark protein [Pseudomonadota bacterium]
MKNRLRWRMGALASAIALLGSLASLDAHALGLGRITVQSALGEPLRAEIDISEISTDEAASLKAGVANAEAFKAAGLEYTTAVAGVQVSLQKRADGSAFLRLSSSRPMTEPFVDLILEASWSSGRIARDYTMLFDPPSLRQPGVAPTAPMLSRPAIPSAPSAAGIGRIPYSPPAASAQPSMRPAPVARAQPAKTSPVPKAAAGGQQLAVKQGDTAGKIAAQNKPAGVSLDQMLVALLRSNPDAFIGGNINRLKSGAMLDIPGADEAGATPAGEASRTIVAQSRDFNEFRRKLAEGVPTTQVGNANRQAGGKVQAKVEDRAPATATPDKLTLSKGAVQGKAAAEDRIAKDRQAKEASDRVAELSKNIGDLNKLAGVPAGAASAAGASLAVAKPGALPASPAPTASAAGPASVAASTPKAATTSMPALAAASAPAALSAPAVTSTAAVNDTATLAALSPASAPAASASAPVAAASSAAVVSAPAAVVAKKPVAAPPPPPEPSLMDELTENPLVLPAFAGLLLLLGGFGFYRYKKRNDAVQVDSSFLESRLQPDSFFGASGGQRIDTNEGGATGSSLVYSPSQLDAAGDVDPVAEADVYLAYGRDLQAEEILKEAMRTSPTRVAIHSKLMEIYAKRRDAKAFEVVAVEAFNLTHGEGPEWAYVGEMGRELDPANPMYQPGGHPQAATPGNASEAQQAGAAAAFGASTIPQMIAVAPEAQAAAVDFDLDLDFSLGDEPVAAAPPPPAVAPAAAAYQPEPTLAMKAAAQDPIFEGLDMDFSNSSSMDLKPTAEPPSASSFNAKTDDSMDLSNGLSFTVDAPPVAAKPAPVAAPVASAPDSGMLEFDLGSLSLDLSGPVTESPTLSVPDAASGDPLETKFALAEEFRALGDMDGARSLAEEVASHSTGSLKSKAQAFLNALS